MKPKVEIESVELIIRDRQGDINYSHYLALARGIRSRCWWALIFNSERHEQNSAQSTAA